jgi:PAS domain S-box-containing protein
MSRSPFRLLWGAVILGGLGLGCFIVILTVITDLAAPPMLSGVTILGIVSLFSCLILATTGFIGSHREVQIQRALSTSRDRFRLLAEHATDIVFRIQTGQAFSVDYVSPSVERILGLRPDEILADPLRLRGLLVPEDLAQIEREGDEFWRRKEIVVRTARADGGVAWWHVRQHTIVNAAGTIEAIEGIARDVSEMKEVEAKLMERERQLSTLLANMPGVAYRSDTAPERHFLVATAGCQDLFGHAVEAFTSEPRRTLGELIEPEDRERVSRELQAALEKRERFTIEFRTRHADGTVRWVWDRGIGIYDPQGRAVAVEGLMMDITARKKADEERDRLLKEAESAVAARESLLAMATHDLRSPLTALKLFVQASQRHVTKEHGPESPEAVRLLARVERQVDRMRTLVDDLLDAARAASGHLELRLQEVDLQRVAHDVAQRIEPQLRVAGCELRLVAGGPLIGRWDPLRLEQVIANLLSNAAKYGASRPVELSIASADDWARIIVQDHGVGLSAEDQQRLFRQFERLSPDHRAGSSGLGLWIVKLLVEALGGTVECVSAGRGEGSTFIVTLPRAGPSTPARLIPVAERVPRESASAAH